MVDCPPTSGSGWKGPPRPAPPPFPPHQKYTYPITAAMFCEPRPDPYCMLELYGSPMRPACSAARLSCRQIAVLAGGRGAPRIARAGCRWRARRRRHARPAAAAGRGGRSAVGAGGRRRRAPPTPSTSALSRWRGGVAAPQVADCSPCCRSAACRRPLLGRRRRRRRARQRRDQWRAAGPGRGTAVGGGDDFERTAGLILARDAGGRRCRFHSICRQVACARAGGGDSVASVRARPHTAACRAPLCCWRWAALECFGRQCRAAAAGREAIEALTAWATTGVLLGPRCRWERWPLTRASG